MTYGHYQKEVLELAEEWHAKVKEAVKFSKPNVPEWEPKNKECIDLYMKCWRRRQQDLEATGRILSRADREDPGSEFWENDMLPYHGIPEEVTTHVNVEVWKELSRKIQQTGFPGWERRLKLAQQVLEQLEHGVSSGVSGRGLLPIKMENSFMDLEIDCPRILDALLSAIR